MKTLFSAVAMVLISGSANAAVYRAEFRVFTGDFVAPPVGLVPGVRIPTPQAETFGRFTFTADSLTGPIQSIFDVSVTFDGFTYTDGNVGFVNNPDGSAYVFGGATLVPLFSGTDDFYVYLSPNRDRFTNGLFATSSRPLGFFSGESEFTFSEAPAVVPLPASGLSLFAGAVLLGSMAYRKKRGTSQQGDLLPRPM